jgi:hypothetical protein
MTGHRSVLLLVVALLAAAPVAAEPTRIDVRVLSKGAKFIGTSMGGVRIEIRDADSGELLAGGVTEGGTGSTQRIMREPLPHHAPVSTPDAAVFHATLDLSEPRRLEVSARGPLAQPQAESRASSTMWVVPGRHVTGGDGWRLELPGFAVDVLDPPAHQKLAGAAREVPIRANVTMMCGCPIEPGGPWDANRLEVRARVLRDGQPAGEVALAFAGQTSQFAGAVPIAEPGAYDVLVFAHDAADGNTGVDRTTFVVEASAP